MDFNDGFILFDIAHTLRTTELYYYYTCPLSSRLDTCRLTSAESRKYRCGNVPEVVKQRTRRGRSNSNGKWINVTNRPLTWPTSGGSDGHSSAQFRIVDWFVAWFVVLFNKTGLLKYKKTRQTVKSCYLISHSALSLVSRDVIMDTLSELLLFWAVPRDLWTREVSRDAIRRCNNMGTIIFLLLLFFWIFMVLSELISSIHCLLSHRVEGNFNGFPTILQEF